MTEEDTEHNLDSKKDIFEKIKTFPVSDDSAKTLEDDLFNFKEQAKILAKLVANNSSPDTISVGISGSWGAGKSSMLNLIKCYLDDTKEYYKLFREDLPHDEKAQKKKLKSSKIEKEMPIIVDFDPWFFGSEEKIIEAFFLKLAKDILKSNSISKEIKNGAGKCLLWLSRITKIVGGTSQIAGNWFSKPIAEGAGQIADVLEDISGDLLNNVIPDFFSIKKELSDNLKKIEKRKIIVVIDNLDRLQADEALTMLKIARLVTDLPKIRTIIAYDQDVLAEVISKKVGGDGYAYIKKMINIPTYLPKVNPDNIKMLLSTSYEKIAEKYSIDLNRSIITFDYPTTDFAEKIVKTSREAKNILNLLDYNLSILEKKVEFYDLLGICLLHYYYPTLFNAFSSLEFPVGGDIRRNRIVIGSMEGKSREKVCEKFEIDSSDPVFQYLNLYKIIKNKDGDEVEGDVDKQRKIYKNSIFNLDNHNKYFCLLKTWANRTIRLKFTEHPNLKENIVITKKDINNAED